MGLISLTDMQFYAYHGFYEEENIIGNTYWVDVHIETDFGRAGMTDELTDTINYETVYFICKTEMKQPRKLLEAVGDSIIARLKFQFSNIQEVRVLIKKANPPLGGQVGFAQIEMDDNFGTACARCGTGMACYGDENCWCQSVNIMPQTLQVLQKQFKGCLCKKCLTVYAGATASK